jgi:hypothetical protein
LQCAKQAKEKSQFSGGSFLKKLLHALLDTDQNYGNSTSFPQFISIWIYGSKFLYVLKMGNTSRKMLVSLSVDITLVNAVYLVVVVKISCASAHIVQLNVSLKFIISPKIPP